LKLVATRCHILRRKCTKFDFGWGSAPETVAGNEGPTSKGTKRKGRGKDGRGRVGGEQRKGKERRVKGRERGGCAPPQTKILPTPLPIAYMMLDKPIRACTCMP